MNSRRVRFIAEIPMHIDRLLRAEAARQKRSRKAHLAFILEERFSHRRNGRAAQKPAAPESAQPEARVCRRSSERAVKEAESER
jgi:hypothetical protein